MVVREHTRCHEDKYLTAHNKPVALDHHGGSEPRFGGFGQWMSAVEMGVMNAMWNLPSLVESRERG